jgi:hypothetical protein
LAVPPKSEQIEKVADFLSDPANEDRTAEELAKIVVNGVYDLWGKTLDDPPLVPHVGMAFSVPFLSSIHFVGWIGEEYGKERIWVINATSDFGFFTTRSSDLWRLASPSRAKVGAPGSNADGWASGDRVSLSQRRLHLTVLETGNESVLMRSNTDSSLWTDSNSNMKKYYTKEKR